jgi:hypothetical protein
MVLAVGRGGGGGWECEASGTWGISGRKCILHEKRCRMRYVCMCARATHGSARRAGRSRRAWLASKRAMRARSCWVGQPMLPGIIRPQSCSGALENLAASCMVGNKWCQVRTVGARLCECMWCMCVWGGGKVEVRKAGAWWRRSSKAVESPGSLGHPPTTTIRTDKGKQPYMLCGKYLLHAGPVGSLALHRLSKVLHTAAYNTTGHACTPSVTEETYCLQPS